VIKQSLCSTVRICLGHQNASKIKYQDFFAAADAVFWSLCGEEKLLDVDNDPYPERKTKGRADYGMDLAQGS
jgi:hypothetical protein